MAKKPIVTTLQSGFNSTEVLSQNFEALRDAFDNTLSLDGSTPNAMEADLDLNGNNIIGATGLLINGTDYLADVEAAKAAALAAQAAAELAENNAETAEVNAEASETAAGLSATAAASSAAASAASAVDATNNGAAQVALAAAQVTLAETAKTGAELAETNAETAESNAATSATNAATSETNAATSAATASTKASEAATSATNAATSETNAASSASSAQASKDAALAALDNFDDRYLGQKASDPTLDNDGDALVAGALYFNTTDDIMKVYEGSVWVAAYASLSGALIANNNLSDLSSVTSARTNLGLGTAATTASTDYATAAQGALADSAVQPNDSPTFAALDVTGTVTADGLTVEAGIAQLELIDTGVSGSTKLRTANANTWLEIDPDNVQPSSGFSTYIDGKQFLSITDLGDISFYEDTGTTRKFFWDASAESLGIGTSSPSAKLHVVGPVASFGSVSPLATFSDGTRTAQVFITGLSYSYAGVGANELWNYTNGSFSAYTIGSDGAVPIKFVSSGSERMRIDSSGNLLVGTTSGSDKVTVNGTVNATAFVGDGSGLTGLPEGGGATGGGTDKIFVENGQVITTNYTVTATTNAMTTGPIDINSGVTVTVETGGRWVVI